MSRQYSNIWMTEGRCVFTLFGSSALSEVKEKYRTEGFSKFKSPETRQVQEREIGLDIRTHASPKVGQVQV